MATPDYIPETNVPLPPKDAEVLSTACDYCIVACGLKVYRWPVAGGRNGGRNGGPKADENADAITKYALRHIATANFTFHDTPSDMSSTPGFRDAGFDNFGPAYEDWMNAETLFICGTDPYETKTMAAWRATWWPTPWPKHWGPKHWGPKHWARTTPSCAGSPPTPWRTSAVASRPSPKRSPMPYSKR